MSSIDNRIVQMEFQHGQFLSGVSQTMKALNLLKKALNFSGVVNADDLRLDTSGLESGLDKITNKFSELGSVGENVFGLLSGKAMEAGKKVADAFFGLDDISAGQSKYETYTKAVQTITNATGKSVEEVEKVLEKLQTYTDETSYDFATMVQTIGKFTAAGVDLEAAEMAMEGIGNEAAKSGASIEQANHAMYNFAQALSQGAVKLQDWKSISNATMSTKEFKEVLIDTAVEAGVLVKKGDHIGAMVVTNQEKLEKAQKALEKAQKATKDRAEKVAAAQEQVAKATKETTVDFKNFETTLTDGWLTTEVLIKALNKYADTSDSNPFGQKAYEAAQKALTFSDAVQAVKDAVSSGWMDTFKYLFGNLDEAMKLWTDVSNALYEYIAIFRDWRNEILKSWHEMGGYNDLIEAASNLWQTFMNIVKGVGEALANVFPILKPENMTQALYDGTKALKDWSADLLEMFGLYQEVNEEEKEVSDKAEEVASNVGQITENTKDATNSMHDLSEETSTVASSFEEVEKGLKRGMRGEEVKKLQEEMMKYGFRLDRFGADGIFGPETQAALKALQKEIGVEQTGAFDEATKAALRTDEALQKLQAHAQKGLSLGDRGESVKELQKSLNKYLGDSEKIAVDGIFGPKTEEAIKKIQKKLGVEQTGTWDKATQAAVKHSKIVLFNLEKINKAITKTSPKDDIIALQKELINFGYLDQKTADGVYGPKTEAAVKKLQKSLGLKETGKWDEATAKAVHDAQVIAQKNNKVAESNKKASETSEKAAESNKKAAEETAKGTGKTTIAMKKLQAISRGFISGIKIVTKFAGSIAEIGKNIAGMFTPIVKDARDFVYFISGMIENLSKQLDEDGAYKKFVDNVTSAFEPLRTFLNGVHTVFHDFLNGYELFLKEIDSKDPAKHNTFTNFLKYIEDNYPTLYNVISAFQKVGETIGNIASSFALFFGLREPVDEAEGKLLNFSKTFEYFVGIVKHSGIIDSLVYAFETITEALSNAGVSFESIGSSFKDSFGDDWLVNIVRNIGLSLRDFLETAGFIIEVVSEIIAYIIENLPGAIEKVKEFWSALTFEGDEKTGKAPGIIGRVTKFFKSILGLTDDNKDAIEYAKSGVGPISLITGALAEESVEGEEHVNKSLKLVKGICGLIKKIFSLIRLTFTGEIGENSGLKQETIERVKGIRETIGKVFDTISFIFTGKETDRLDKGFIEKVNSVKDKINGAFNLISNAFESIISSVSYFISGSAFKDLNLSDEVKKRIDGIKEWLGNVWKVLTTLFTGEKAEGLKSNIAEKAIAFREWINTTFEKLKEVFGGIFARIAYFIGGLNFKDLNLSDEVKKRIDGIKGLLGNVWKVLITLFTGEKAEGIKSNIAEKAIAFREWINTTFEKLKEVFGGIFARIAYFIGGLNFKDLNLSDEVKKRIDGIKGLLGDIWSAINILISGKRSERGSLSPDTADKIVAWHNRIFGIFKKIGNAISPFISDPAAFIKLLFGGKKSDRGFLSSDVADRIIAFRENIINVVTAIKDTFSGIFDFVGGMFGSGSDIEKSSDAAEESADGDLSGKLISIGVKIAGVITAVKFIGGAISGFKDSLGIGKEKEKNGFQKIADALLKIAISFGIIAAAIIIIGKYMTGTELAKGIAGLAVVAGVIVGVFALIKKISSSGNKEKKTDFSVIKNIGKAIMDLAEGIGILTAALIVLGKVDAGTFLSGLWKLGVMLGATIGFLALLKLIKFDKLNIKGFWDLALGIEILAIVVHTLSGMSWDQMGRGLAGLAGVMLLMTGLMWVMGKVGATKIKLKGFNEFAQCVAIIGATMKSLAKMSWPEIAKSLVGLLAIMGSMAGIIALVGHFGDNLKPTTLAVMFGGMALAIGVFGHVIKKIKGTDPNLLYAFSISLAIALGAFVAACMFVGGGTGNSRAKAMLKGAGAIAAALGIFVTAAVIIVGGLGELDRIEGLDLKGSIERGKVILGLTAEALRDFGDKLGLNLPIIAGVLAASLIVGLIPNGAISLIEGAGAISVALGELAVAASIVIFGLGKLDSIAGLKVEECVKTGGEILESVAETLSAFGEKLGLNLPIIAGILAASLIVGLIPGGAGALELGALAISGAAGTIISVLTTLVAGLGKLDEWTNGGLSAAIDRGGDVLESISTAIARVKSGFTKVYNEDLKEFGEAMKSIREGIDGASDDDTLDEDMTAAVGIAEKLHTFFSSLTPYNLTDASGFVTEYTTTASLLLADVSAFGTAISDLWNGVTGISKDKNIDTDVDTSIEVVKSLKTKFFDVIGNSDTMPSGSGLEKYNEKIGGILGNVKTFGESIGTFHTNISGISKTQIESDTQAAIDVASTVATFLSDLSTHATTIENNKGALDKFFTGDTKQETVFDSMDRLGQSISGSKDAFAGLTDSTIVTDVEAAVNVAKSTADLLSHLGEGDVYSNITSGAVGLEALGAMFNDSEYSLATIIKTFADQLKNIDNLPEVSNIFAGFGALANMLSADTTLKDDFSKAGISFSNHILTAFSNNDVTQSNDVPKKMLNELKKNEYIEAFRGIGKNYVVGITEGVVFNGYIAEKAAEQIAIRMKSAVERVLQIASPSKVGKQLGQYFVEGIAIGSSENANKTETSAREAAEGMIGAVSNVLANINAVLAEGLDVEPVISPVVDMTNVQAAKDSLPGLFNSAGIPVKLSSEMAEKVAEGHTSADRFKYRIKDLDLLGDRSGTYANGNKPGSFDVLAARFDKLAERMENLKIVLDTGEVVGATSSAYDKQFGIMAGRRERGN